MSTTAAPAPHAGQATRQRAARDILMQVVVRVLNLALGVVVTALLARALGSVYYGQWSTVLVVLGLVSYLASFGMERVVVREAAAHPETEHEWLGAMMTMRLILFAPAVACSVAAVVALSRSHQMLVAGLVLVMSMPFDGVGVLQLVFQLRVNNFVPMAVLTLRSVLWAAAVALIYWRGGDMVAFAIALAVTNSAGSVVQTAAARRVLGRWPRPSRKRLRPLLQVGIPLGVSGVLVIGYARVDQLIVYTLAGSRPAGLYSAVYGVLEQAHFVPISIMTTLGPVIAASWAADRARMLRIVGVATELMTVGSLGALAFAIAASTQVVTLVFGPSFRAAAPALPVLGAAFVFICYGYINGNLLAVLGLQRRLLRVSLAALVCNIAGNLVLVPAFGFMGAAWMTLLTEVLVCALSLRLILGALGRRLPWSAKIARTVLAAGLLTGGLLALRAAGASLAELVAAACVVYPTLLFGLRALALDDVRALVRRGAAA